MSTFLPTVVYLLCFATSATCAYLLARSYRRTSARLLLWSALCFVLLAANNLVVIIDIVVLPDWDLRILRDAFSLAAIAVLLFGFIWDIGD